MTVVTHGEASTCWHEAHHVASAILDGMTPKSVAVDVRFGLGDRGNERTLGYMYQDNETLLASDRNLRCHMVSLLLGSMCHGLEPQASIECWPVDPSRWLERNRSDARGLKFVAKLREMDQVGWGRVVYTAQERTKASVSGGLCVPSHGNLRKPASLTSVTWNGSQERLITVAYSPRMGRDYSLEQLLEAADAYEKQVGQARELKKAAARSTAGLLAGLERAEKIALAQHVKAINAQTDAKALALLREFGMADPN